MLSQSMIDEVNKDTALVDEFKVQMTPSISGKWHNARRSF